MNAMREYRMSFRIRMACLVGAWLPMLVCAQVDTAWVRRYNGTGNAEDWASAIAVDLQGNVFVTGRSLGSGTGYDYATVKYDASGTELWVRRYDGTASGDDWAKALVADDSGGVWVAGQSRAPGADNDIVTIRYLASGDTQWLRRYNGLINCDDCPAAIARDRSGNVFVTGTSQEAVIQDTSYDYLTIGYRPNGETLWIRRFNGPAQLTDDARAVAVDDSGNVLVTGEAFSDSTGFDYLTLKYAPNGTPLWGRYYTLPGNRLDCARAIVCDDSGNVYVAGESGDSAGCSFATIKYAPDGTLRWAARYPGPDNIARAMAVACDDSGNVYVTGTVLSGSATVKYDRLGNQAWAVIEPAGQTAAIALDAAGGVCVTGTASSGNGDFLTIDYRSDSVERWSARYDCTGWTDQANAVATDAQRNVYVTGPSDGGASGLDYATVKYIQPGSRVAEGTRPQPLRAGLSCHPNPSRDWFRLDCAPGASDGIMVFSAGGRRVASLKPGETVWRPSVQVAPGLYFLRTSSGTNSVVARAVYLGRD